MNTKGHTAHESDFRAFSSRVKLYSMSFFLTKLFSHSPDN
ncbi:hypothetical protein BVRB_8g197050 [Beta vulgaris subsp. vulgaris]|nr:hypothetical protein BVRB_8g197050 [Beta vulgaris subsp. vulgaris]